MTRNYPTLIQEYMEKKREDRKKKDIEQRHVMRMAEIEKRKKLEVSTNDNCVNIL